MCSSEILSALTSAQLGSGGPFGMAMASERRRRSLGVGELGGFQKKGARAAVCHDLHDTWALGQAARTGCLMSSGPGAMRASEISLEAVRLRN